MTHIGIEECIVQKFHLNHWEKEGLVDLICTHHFKDLLPDYVVQKSVDNRIAENITDEDIETDLPAAVKRYVEKFPRTE